MTGATERAACQHRHCL